jgi:hypothetical protein
MGVHYGYRPGMSKARVKNKAQTEKDEAWGSGFASYTGCFVDESTPRADAVLNGSKPELSGNAPRAVA